MAAKKTTRKKSTSKRNTADRHKAAANKSRKDLLTRLKKDLQASKKALTAASKAANAELKLAKAAARAEINVLRDQLKVALKREEALRKLSQEKARRMLQAGEQWEKKQLAKIKSVLKRG